MGFEYMFFDEGLRDRFIAFAAARGIASTVRQDDALQDAFEAEYEAIMEEQMLLAEADTELVSHHAAGVMVTLADGTTRAVRIPPPIARRLFEHFSPEEVHEIASAIAHSIENPIDGPVCRKPPE